jgi:hypothetical protein
MQNLTAKLIRVVLLSLVAFVLVFVANAQDVKVFSVALTGDSIAPQSIDTPATGGAGATLKGSKLRVKGSFSNLTGNLRDYRVDPSEPPNPRITSAVHIHRGSPKMNGPFQYALGVDMSASQRQGTFQGEFDLSSEQLQALLNGQLYIDIHTTTFRGGELRGTFVPN